MDPDPAKVPGSGLDLKRIFQNFWSIITQSWFWCNNFGKRYWPLKIRFADPGRFGQIRIRAWKKIRIGIRIQAFSKIRIRIQQNSKIFEVLSLNHDFGAIILEQDIGFLKSGSGSRSFKKSGSRSFKKSGSRLFQIPDPAKSPGSATLVFHVWH